MKKSTRAGIRNAVTTLLEVVGLGAVTYGTWLIAPAAGFIVGGVGLIAFSYLIVRNGEGK